MGWMVFIEEIDAAVTDAELNELVAEHGTVLRMNLAKDEASASGTQVAFVTMQSAKDGRALISSLDGREYRGHTLKAKPLKGHGGSVPGSGTTATGTGVRPLGRGQRAGVFGGKSSMFEHHKGRGKSGGRSQ